MPTFCACAFNCRKRVAFKGMYAKGHQPAGTSSDPDGKLKALQDKWNPTTNLKWNPNAKKQKKYREENEARINELGGDEKILTDEQAMKVAKDIMFGVFGVLPLKDLIGKGSWYFGYTKRTTKEEGLRWCCTERGAGEELDNGDWVWNGAVNRPVLRWADGALIKESAATNELKFVIIEIYASTLMVNARYVEKALQSLYMHVPLGTRLWRIVDKGKKYDTEIDGNVHKVFVTLSHEVPRMVAEGTIQVVV